MEGVRIGKTDAVFRNFRAKNWIFGKLQVAEFLSHLIIFLRGYNWHNMHTIHNVRNWHSIYNDHWYLYTVILCFMHCSPRICKQTWTISFCYILSYKAFVVTMFCFETIYFTLLLILLLKVFLLKLNSIGIVVLFFKFYLFISLISSMPFEVSKLIQYSETWHGLCHYIYPTISNFHVEV